MNSPTPNLNSPNIDIQNQGVQVETPQMAFAPLPIRARTTLEVMDVAVKLYRRYFGVLILWSMLVSAIYVVSSIIPFLYLLGMPLVYGSVSCAIAAAVRGEKISFGQVWNFTKPRYGALIGVFLLSIIVFGMGVGVFCIAAALIYGLGIFALGYLPDAVAIVVGIIGFIALLVAYCVVCAVGFGWLNLVPIVACLEDDKRSSAAMSRAWTLFTGHWKRVMTITVLLGVAIFIFFGIVASFVYFIGAGADVFTNIEGPGFWALMLGMTAIMAVFSVFWTPAQAMIIAVLYLDLRVRKEALDIEWTDYSSKAALAPNDGVPMDMKASPVEMLTNTQESSPSSFGAGQNAATANVAAANISTPDATVPQAGLTPGFAPAPVESVFPPVEPVAPVSMPAPTPFSPAEAPVMAQEPAAFVIPVPESPVSVPPTPSASVEAQPVEETPYSSFAEHVKVAPIETSSFAPPSFSVDTSPMPSPFSTPAPAPADEAASTDVSPFGLQPEAPKPEDSHEPRF